MKRRELLKQSGIATAALVPAGLAAASSIQAHADEAVLEAQKHIPEKQTLDTQMLLNEINLLRKEIAEIKKNQTISFAGSELKNANFMNATIIGDFTGTDCNGASFMNAKFHSHEAADMANAIAEALSHTTLTVESV